MQRGRTRDNHLCNHNNVSQKQHAKSMINYFLITKHGKDN